MGIRETLNENPRITTGITIGIIVVVLLVIVLQMRGGDSAPLGGGTGGTTVYFSDDDGKNYFPDDMKKVPPFDHGGKEAVRAYVFECDGKTFVNHLVRYTPDAKKRLEAMGGTISSGDPTAAESIQAGMELKRPGEKEWVKANEPRADEIRRVPCKDMDSLREVRP